MVNTFSALPDLLSYLQIGKTTFFKWKKQGRIEVEVELVGGKWQYTLLKAPTHREILGEDDSKLVNEWIAWRESGLHCRPWSNTYKEIQTLYVNLYFQRFKLVSYQSLQEWLLEIPNKQLSKRRHRHSAISSFAKFLQVKGLISREEHNQIVELYPKRPPTYEPQQRIIYEDDLQTLITEASKAHSSYQKALNTTLLIFLSETGLRASECCNLTKDSFRFSDNPKEATIKVRLGKGGKSRVVPFSKRAQEAIRSYLKVRPDSEHPQVFLAFNPRRGYTTMDKGCLSRRFQTLSVGTGIPFSAHSLRHYRITQWANNPKIPITATQKWAGHSSLTMTQKYIHTTDDDAFNAAFGT